MVWRMHDQEVVDFCRTYLTVNRQAFSSEKLCLIINDARCVCISFFICSLLIAYLKEKYVRTCSFVPKDNTG